MGKRGHLLLRSTLRAVPAHWKCPRCPPWNASAISTGKRPAVLPERHLERLQRATRKYRVPGTRVLGAPRASPRGQDAQQLPFPRLISVLFPGAVFLHCRRDLRDVALSCWMTDFGSVSWACNPDHIASRFADYRRLMDHWREVLPAPFLNVDYEEMVEDLEGVARRMIEWCGLEWEPQCLRFHETRRTVQTASAVQVRGPIYKTSVGHGKTIETRWAICSRACSGGNESGPANHRTRPADQADHVATVPVGARVMFLLAAGRVERDCLVADAYGLLPAGATGWRSRMWARTVSASFLSLRARAKARAFW